MLLKIRDLATGWLAVLIVAILVIPFAFFGIDYYFSQGSEPVVAEVNDTEIKQTQFQRALANYHQQMQNIMGSSVDPDDPFIKQQTLNRMIDAEVMNQTILSSGLNIENKSVLETIRDFDVFQDSDGFDAELYQRSINSMGTPPAVFEQQVKLDMMSEQMEAAISESSFTTDKELESIVSLKKQTRDFSYVLVSAKSIEKGIEVTEEELENYYQQNKASFRKPKQIKIEYIHLTQQKVADTIQIDESEIENYFVNNQSAYNIPEKRKIWQIKVGKPEDATEEQLQQAKAKAEELLKVTETMASFESIAETMSSNSEDKIKVDVSESGFREKGKNLKIIDDVVFSLNKGETGEIIEDTNAYYIVNLVDIEEMQEVSLEEVKDTVTEDLKLEKAQKEYYQIADQLAALSYEHPDTLEVASDAIDVAREESVYFSNSGIADDNLLSNDKILSASFSDDVMNGGNNSDIIELSDTDAIVLRVIDVKQETQLGLDEVREEVTAVLTNTKAQDKAREIGTEILSALSSGEPVEALLDSNNLELTKAESVNRDDISVNRSVLRTAFRLEPPSDNKPSVDGSQLGNGDYIVVSLASVAKPEKIMGIDIDNQSKEMQRIRADSDWDGFFNALKAGADIVINDSNL